MIEGVYGLNIAVKDLGEATARFESLLGVQGTSMESTDFAFPGLEGTRLDFSGLAIHLIASDDPETSVGRFVEKRGEGVFLVSLRTNDLDAVMMSLKDQGIGVLLDPPVSSALGRVTFVHPKYTHGVQLEILETP